MSETVLIDYGAGNLHSVHKALLAAGLDARVSADPAAARDARALILPGQGHFGQVMRSFRASGFEEAVRQHLQARRPFLGICVGLQLLMDGSDEAPGEPGLGLLPGRVKRFPAGVRVPQMGWNRVRKLGDSPLLEGVPDGSHAYFANSYYADPDLGGDISGATTEYGSVRFLSALSHDNLHATQFHPEKSQQVGLKVLENFRRITERPPT